MKRAVASVALLGLVVMGCNATGGKTTENPDPDETTTGGTTMGTTGGGDGNAGTGDSGNITTGAGTGTAGFSSGTFGSSVTVTSGVVTGGPGSVGGVGGAGGDSGVECDDGAGGEGGARNYPEDPYPAIAMTRAQRQVLFNEEFATTGGVSTTGSGVEEDPDDLWVVISDTAMRCDQYPRLECGGHWEVSLMLTQSMRQVGVHDLAGEWFGQSSMGEAEDPSMPDVCPFGGGGGTSCGTFELLEISGSEIRFRLDVDPWAVDDDIAGIYTVPLCPK